MKPVLVIGSLAYDRIMDFAGNFSEHFLPDKLHSINLSFFVSPPTEGFGGTGGNIAYGLGLLGTPVAVAGTVGNDFARYQSWLFQHDVGTTLVVTNELPTASSYIMTDEKDNQIAAFSGSAMMRPYTATLPFADHAACIVSPTNRDDMVQISRNAKKSGVPFFFDPGQQIPMLSGEELREAITGSTGLLLNDYELALILEKTGWTEAELQAQVDILVITLGADGSRIITKEGETRIAAALAKKVVDPTGAGDAYRAGFLAGYVHGLSPVIAAQIGSVVAAYAVECYGTQNHHFTREDLASRYEAVYKQPFPF